MMPVARRGFAGIGLHMPKDPANIGGVLRAAHCYDAALVAATGKRWVRSGTDTTKAYRHLPFLQVERLLDVVPFDCVPVAVELIEGARDLASYAHPERAFYIFGQEDGTLGANITSKCRDIVFIPTRYCMNLAACVNVVLYDRLAKQQR